MTDTMISQAKMDQIFKQALKLSPIEKARLVDQLLSSLDKSDEEIEDIALTNAIKEGEGTEKVNKGKVLEILEGIERS